MPQHTSHRCLTGSRTKFGMTHPEGVSPWLGTSVGHDQRETIGRHCGEGRNPVALHFEVLSGGREGATDKVKTTRVLTYSRDYCSITTSKSRRVFRSRRSLRTGIPPILWTVF